MNTPHISDGQTKGYSRNTAQASSPAVLVLLAAYNGAKWIQEQIESILSQNHVAASIVISDDNSTDETRTLLEHSFGDNPRITILPPSKPSGSASQNFFSLIRRIPIGNFDYVALSDQDDVWFPNKLVDAITAIENSSAVAYSSATIARWPDGSTHLITLDRPQTCSDYLFEGAGQGCTFLLSRNFYADIHEFLSKHTPLTASLHFHDWTIYALARSWGLTWQLDPTPSMTYRQHASNDTGARTSIRGILNRFASIRNGWYFTQLSLIASICHKAAPNNYTVTRLHQLLNAPRTISRTFSLIRFCLNGGRRRRTDNLILIFACTFGWI